MRKPVYFNPGNPNGLDRLHCSTFSSSKSGRPPTSESHHEGGSQPASEEFANNEVVVYQRLPLARSLLFFTIRQNQTVIQRQLEMLCEAMKSKARRSQSRGKVKRCGYCAPAICTEAAREQVVGSYREITANPPHTRLSKTESISGRNGKACSHCARHGQVTKP